MAARAPEVIRKAWGEEVTAAAVPWIEEIIESRAVPRDEYRQVLSRLDVLEHDVADIKITLRQLNKRFDQMYRHFETLFDRQQRHTELRFDKLNERLDQLAGRFDEQLGQMEGRFNERLDKMNALIISQTRWVVGTLVAFGALVTLLMAMSQFAP